MKKKKLCLLLGVIAILALMVLAVNGRVRFPLLNRFVIAVMMPLNTGIQTVTNSFDRFGNKVTAFAVLEEENKQLKKEVAELHYANIKMAEFYAENMRLRELLGYKEKAVEQQLLVAKVVGRNMGDLRDILIINKGTNDGIRSEMAVVVGDGLVGLVDEVYPEASKVLLLTSNRCRIGGRILRADSRAVGVVKGLGTDEMPLELEHLPRETEMQKGDIVVTSGYSGRHPSGLIIGTVIDSKLEAAGLLRTANIAPMVDNNKIEEVLIVTDYKNPLATIQQNSSETGGQAQ